MSITTTTTYSAELMALVDASVEAIDIDRSAAVDRVREALAPFGASTLFAAELRLNGRPSDYPWHLPDGLGLEVEF